MSLSSGEKVVRYRWTELPMPVEAIERISNIGRGQGMPSTLTYANRHGKEIGDTVATSNHHDKSYSDDDDTSEASVSSSDDSISEDNSTSDGSDSDSNSSSSDDSSDDDSNFELKTTEANPNRRVRFQAPAQAPLIVVAPSVADPPAAPQMLPNQGVYPTGAPGVDNPGVEDDLVTPETPPDDDGSENVRNEHDDDDSEDSQNSAPDGVRTESERFRNAENEGRRRAAQQNTTRPVRNTLNTMHDDFAYTVFDLIHQSLGLTPSYSEHAEAYVTAQMSAKKGLNVFGQQGADAQMKELRQLVIIKVMNGVESHKLTKEPKLKSL